MANEKDRKLAAKERRLAKEALENEIQGNRLLLSLSDAIGQKVSENVENYEKINTLKDETMANMVKQKANEAEQLKILDEYNDQMAVLMDRRTKAYKQSEQESKVAKLTFEAEKKRLKLTDELKSKSDGLLDGLESQVKQIPLIGGLLAQSADFGGLKEKMGDTLNGITENFMDIKSETGSTGAAIKGSFKSAIPGIKAFGASLKSALLPLLPFIAAFAAIKTIFDFDKKVTELSRNLGISRDAAEQMSVSFNNMALTSGDLSITSAGLLEAQQQLSESTGMSAQFSEDMLSTQIKLTKFMGLSGKEAASFQKLSMANEMSARDLQLEVVGTVEQFNKATGASVNLNDVMKDISNLSQTIKANFKGNVVEMAKAATLARSMGISLQDSANAAERTLSIEESLKNEMTAMMVAGVRINNNEVRQAQLAGDTKKVLELQKQQLDDMGDISDKTPMQRKAIADAMGLEVDKLLEMNEQNQLSKKLGIDVSKATLAQIDASTTLTKEEKEKLIAQREQMSMQEKMNALTNKLGEIFQSLAPSLLAIAEIFGSIIGFIGTAIESLGGLKFILKSIATLYVIKAAYAVYSSLASIPFVGAGIGLAASIATLAGGLGLIASVGDVMSPADGKTRVSTKEGGLFELSPNDDLMAAPGIFDGGGTGGGGSTIDLSGLINEIKGLRKDIQAQPIQVTVDGRVVSEISRVQRQQDSVRTTGYGR